MSDRIIKYAGLFITSVVFCYIFLAFFSPVLMKYGYYDFGVKIQNVYAKLCHQRVERSLFLFSDYGVLKVYSSDELYDIGFYAGKENVKRDRFGVNNIDGHGEWGEERMGYKVAICIRDIGLYLSFLIVSLVIHAMLLFKLRVEIGVKVFLLFLSPIFIDVFLQLLIELTGIIVPEHWFFDNIYRRIFTSVLAGSGLAIFIIPKLLTSGAEKEKI